MSRSYKKAILKDKGLKKIYWKIIRHITKKVVDAIVVSYNRTGNTTYVDTTIPENLQLVDTLEIIDENINIPSPKSIMNDYDYCDYIIDYEHNRSLSYFWYGKNYNGKYWKIKYSRK